jgi:2-phosphosulfolactate phosphatase
VTGAGFAIDALPESADLYRKTHAIVAIDVFRSMTVIVTGLAKGRKVFPVGTLGQAVQLGQGLDHPLLAGEHNGIQPSQCEIDNSPAELERRSDLRPLVLVSSAGTVLLARSAGASAVYVSCFRNLSATVGAIIGRHPRVALIGAGTRGEARIEDQMLAVRMGQRLLQAGYRAENSRTRAELDRYAAAEDQRLASGDSAAFLRKTGRHDDIDFVLTHIDDVDYAVGFDGTQAVLVDTGVVTESALSGASDPVAAA